MSVRKATNYDWKTENWLFECLCKLYTKKTFNLYFMKCLNKTKLCDVECKFVTDIVQQKLSV